jgi:hypothetical protein
VVKIYERDTDEAIRLDTFFDNIAAITLPRFSSEYVDACARELGRLGNNRELVWQHLSGGLAGWGRSLSPPQSFILGISRGFMVRANIWLPPKLTGSAADAYYKRIYSYDLAHNHDFHFLTVGYYGPGYETDLYQANADALRGEPGEAVQLSSHQREQLTPGRVIYFKAYDDVHIQHEPAELSVSLNLLFTGERRVRDQLVFDVEKAKVIGPPTAGVSGRWRGAVGMSALVGNERTWQLLEEIAATDKNPRMRESALQALKTGRDPGELLTRHTG